jgi:hypothetical protein
MPLRRRIAEDAAAAISARRAARRGIREAITAFFAALAVAAIVRARALDRNADLAVPLGPRALGTIGRPARRDVRTSGSRKEREHECEGAREHDPK